MAILIWKTQNPTQFSVKLNILLQRDFTQLKPDLNFITCLANLNQFRSNLHVNQLGNLSKFDLDIECNQLDLRMCLASQNLDYKPCVH